MPLSLNGAELIPAQSLLLTIKGPTISSLGSRCELQARPCIPLPQSSGVLASQAWKRSLSRIPPLNRWRTAQ
jgi:hypothetical protein